MSDLDLSARNIVVTGAGAGIGRAIVLRLSQLGARVALLGRRRTLLDEVAGQAKNETRVLSVDVRDRTAQEEAFSEVAKSWGPLHAVVANAGVGGPNGPGPDDRWDEVIRTNLDGTYFSLRAFQQHWAPGPEERHAVVISSCLGRFGVPGYSAYCASKAGLLGLVRSLALEWAAQRVLVNAVCPGWVDTEMARSGMQDIANITGKPFEEAKGRALKQVPLQRMSEPDEIAGIVAFLLSPDARSFTGQAFDPNGGSWMG